MNRSVQSILDRNDRIKGHAAYNDAIRTAAQQAFQGGLHAFRKWDEGDHSKQFNPPCIHVWFDGKVMFVRGENHPVPHAELVCIAQYFSRRSVQIRFSGGHSEFIDY